MVAPIVYTLIYTYTWYLWCLNGASMPLQKKPGQQRLGVFGFQEEAMADKEPGWAPSNEAESISVLTHPKTDEFFE